MIQREVINKNTGEKLIIFQDEDFERENPIKYYGDSYIVKYMVMKEVPREELNGDKKPSEQSKNIFKEAVKEWINFLKASEQVNIPENLLKLLGTNKKQEQENLLKGLILTPDILTSFIFKAFKDFGYTLSQYVGEYNQKGLDLSKMPLAYNVKDNGEVEVFGTTELSDGQLKQAVQHRKIIVSKFIELGDEWHCFFTTYKSLRGEETWLGEKQPHFHYISNAFGIPKEEVVKQLKSEKYRLGNLPHIKLEDYGSQPDNQSEELK